MTSQQRQAVRERFGFRCGYCGVHEHQVGAELAIDHFQPRSHGGTDELDNLVITHFVGTRCHACNSHKGDYWQSGTPRRLLHPLRDNLAEHLTSSDDGTLRGLTETGTSHIQRLRLKPARVGRTPAKTPSSGSRTRRPAGVVGAHQRSGTAG